MFLWRKELPGIKILIGYVMYHDFGSRREQVESITLQHIPKAKNNLPDIPWVIHQEFCLNDNYVETDSGIHKLSFSQGSIVS
jgi:hypothetical protein